MSRYSRSIFVRNPSSPAAWKDRRWAVVAMYAAVTIGMASVLVITPDVRIEWYAVFGGLWAILTTGLAWRLWWIRTNLHPPGHCQSCGYSLCGNVSGVCPECGTPGETR